MSKYRICRACELPDAPKSFAEIEQSIIENNMISPHNMVDNEIYLKRLEICISCPSLSDVTCLECGCFVQLRAYQGNKDCPHMNGDRWND